MLADSEKFKAIVLANEKQNIDSFHMSISGKAIFLTDSVDLLGITIDNRFNFDKHLSGLCRKVAVQLKMP